MNFSVYIPARYGSTRLPGKPLRELAGRPLIAHVCERAVESGAAEVVIATDHQQIADVARACGAEVCITDAALASGTDRIAAAARQRAAAADQIVVNLQGDEPQMPAAVIRQVAQAVAHGGCDMVSVCEPLEPAQIDDPNVVKVVRDGHCNALYFSRAPIPWERDTRAAGGTAQDLTQYRRHVGIYGYRVSYLEHFVGLPVAALERCEALEQLRALHDGACIHVPDACAPCGTGIDTEADVARFERNG